MAAAILVVAATVVLQARLGVISFPGRDPCWEFSGWGSVQTELQARGLIDQPDTFLFTSCWDDSGQLAFAMRNKVPVICYSRNDARGFAFWSRPEDWVGKDGLLVSLDNNDGPRALARLRPYFDDMELVATFPMTRGGKPFRSVRVYRCKHQVRPFPFDYKPPPKSQVARAG
jgi:hypothetical protein